MGSALMRQWLVLAMVPKAPRRVDATSIAASLAARGLTINLRTVQRDLIELASVFPIVADERSKPYGWRWSGEAPFLLSIPPAPGARLVSELRLTIRVVRSVSRAVLEALRARDAHSSPDPTDPASTIAEATVDDDALLRRVILGFADAVEVLGPPAMRLQTAEAAQRTARRYFDE